MAGKPAYVNQFYRGPNTKNPVSYGHAVHAAAKHLAGGGSVNIGGGKTSKNKKITATVSAHAENYRNGAGAHMGKEKAAKKAAKAQAAASGKKRK